MNCLYPSQCGPGMDCSACYSAHVATLEQKLSAAEQRERELVEALIPLTTGTHWITSDHINRAKELIANSRRIVACVNKLAGIPTEDLENERLPLNVIIETSNYDELHKVKDSIDDLQRQKAELEALIKPIANSHSDNEGTDRPIWWIISPDQNMRACHYKTYSTFFGPFWSRESAGEYLSGRRHHFGKKAEVFCGSCNDSPILKVIYDKSKALAAGEKTP